MSEPVSAGTYRLWRKRDPEFAVAVDRIRSIRRDSDEAKKNDPEFFKKLTFTQKRKRYFGFDTPWFQQATVDAYDKARPGDITLVLMPPEHGKTTLTEDDLTITIADDPNVLITCISESQNMARKMSNRLMRRLSSNGSALQLVVECGPFEPQTGEDAMRQAWSVDAWSVFKSTDKDARDYTFATGGWRSAIAGTRATRLHIDDIQSRRSLEQTSSIWGTFRQDMLSRPGETGTTSINGTRVGEQDFYERMDDEFRGEKFYRKIEFPAIIIDNAEGESKPLWEYDPISGTGYTMEQLDRLRKKVGEEAWWRNYMQKPQTTSLVVFSDECIEKSKNTMRSVNHRRNECSTFSNGECWITLDPSIGGINVVAALHPEADKLYLLDIQEDTDLMRNSSIANAIESVVQRVKARGFTTTMLVIEAMAFQKGLMEDEFITDVARRHGMRLESHLTGINKYDENIGIPSMASSFEAGAFDLPYATDYDKAVSDQLIAQLRAWKPTRDRITGKLKFKRGNQLRQDQLMAVWFAWIWWTELRTSTLTDLRAGTTFTRAGLPFAPTRGGLLIPR